MISTSAQTFACGLQGSERGCRNAKNIVGNCRGHQYPVYAPPHIPACDFRSNSSGSSNSSRRLPTCFAQPEVGGYTPADYISFSKDDNKQCHHNAAVIVDAPLDVCYSLWSDWTKLLDFFDLVGQIGLDNSNPHMALFQCFYRFRKLPLMEIVFLLERQEHHHHESYRSISFNSVYGMPIKGQVEFIEQTNGTTAVRFYFTHPVPNLLVQLQIGPFGVETDMMQILRENFIAFRTQAEAAAPADWPKQREQVAAKMHKFAEEHPEGLVLQQDQPPPPQQQQQQEQQEQEQEQQPEPQQLQEQPSLPQQEPKQQTRKQQASASASPAQQQEASAAPKRPRGRSTASKASTAAADTAAPPVAPQDDAAAAAAAGKKAAARGRKTTRSRSTSTAAAGAGADGNSSRSSGGAAQRRSRMSSSAAEAAAPTEGSSSSNGTGTPAGSSSTGKGGARRSTTRRSSKRPSTAAQE